MEGQEPVFDSKGKKPKGHILDSVFDGRVKPFNGKDCFDYGERTTAEGPWENSREGEWKTKFGKLIFKTDTGGENAKYKDNEDSLFAVSQESRLVAGIVDGAGGSGNGRLASRIGVAVFAKGIRDGKSFREAYDVADLAVKEEDKRQKKVFKRAYGACSAVEIASVKNIPMARVMAAGDCKVMTIRARRKYDKGTTDLQNEAYRAVKYIDPQDYYTSPDAHLLTGGIGIDETGVPEKHKIEKPIFLKEFPVQPGDLFIIASDGFWDIVSEYEVTELAKSSKSPGELHKKLFELAYKRNNSVEPFIIKHSADIMLNKQLSMEDPFNEEKITKAGDNITLVVFAAK